jgi:hypothetical protein
MKSILPLIIGFALAANGCASDIRLVKQDDLVKIYERISSLPHGYGDEILEFKGKQYHHLIGAGYVRLSGKDAILFVTEGLRGRVLHVVPIGKGKESEINLGDTSFGSGLGLPKDDSASNYIESADGDKITFAAKGGSFAPGVVRWIIDLKAKTFAERLPSENNSPPSK